MRRTPRKVRTGKVPLSRRMRPDEQHTEDRQNVPQASGGSVFNVVAEPLAVAETYFAGNHGKNAFVFAM